MLRFEAPKPWGLYFSAPGGAFKAFVGGNLRHLGGFELVWRGRPISLVNFELRPSSRELTLEMLDAQGEIVFFVDHVHALLDVAARRLSMINMDVRVSETLARRLGEGSWAGLTLASMAVHAEVDIPTGACSSPNWPPQFDADVALLAISQVQQAAREPGVRVAITPSASLWNVGQADVPWYEAFTEPSPPYKNDQHPFLVWALYRVADGRIEQLGQSEVKHAFFTVNSGPCPCSGGHILWIDCQDTYGVGTNNSREWLAPREEITAHTGMWARCGFHFDPDCDGDRDHGGGDPHDTFDHRLVVAESDLETDPADYYFEAWYVVRDDVNIFNTMGYATVTPTLVGGTWMFFPDPNLVPGPAVDAWIDPANPPPGTRNESVSNGKGHLHLLVSVAPLGGGLHRYEYALMNHDFDAQIEAFEIPLPQGIVVSNVSSQAATAILDILEPGLGTDLAVASLGPAPAEIFSDGFESGDTSAWGAAP